MLKEDNILFGLETVFHAATMALSLTAVSVVIAPAIPPEIKDEVFIKSNVDLDVLHNSTVAPLIEIAQEFALRAQSQMTYENKGRKIGRPHREKACEPTTVTFGDWPYTLQDNNCS